jgi:hypothetical protein
LKKIIFITILFYSYGCDVPTDELDAPAKPIWIEKSESDNKIELGIDSDNTTTSGIVLMWHANSENDLAGYNIYRGQESNGTTIQFENLAEINIFQKFEYDTLYFDITASNNVTYFFYIEAEDLAGNKSRPSDTISYTLHLPPTALSPVNTIADSFPIFRWIDNIENFQYTSEFVIRVEKSNENSTEPFWVCRFYNQWFGYENTIPISFLFFPAMGSWDETNIDLHTNAPSNVISCYGTTSAMSNGTYRWKIKAISQVNNETGVDDASGESAWSYFNIEI